MYPWGTEFVPDDAVYRENSGGQTADAGSRPAVASWVGAFDMSGNAREWTLSHAPALMNNLSDNPIPHYKQPGWGNALSRVAFWVYDGCLCAHANYIKTTSKPGCYAALMKRSWTVYIDLRQKHRYHQRYRCMLFDKYKNSAAVSTAADMQQGSTNTSHQLGSWSTS